MTPDQKMTQAATAIRNSSHTVAFSGAGISVESGIPPFRGADGLWAKYNPTFLDISYFSLHPRQSWTLIKEIFYDFMGHAEPNAAHRAIAEMERRGFVKGTITQNIDNLHQEAGSLRVHEYHGTTRFMTCLGCHKRFAAKDIDLGDLPPDCPDCGRLLKPDFVFFGEPIPSAVNMDSVEEAERADVMLVVGTTGEITPACRIPWACKMRGCLIIEVNIAPSAYTGSITDIFLQGPATAMLSTLADGVLGDDWQEHGRRDG